LRINYTDRQWRKGYRGKYNLCKKKLKDMGTEGLILERNNSTSYGLVDGY
jgi:hypothetical protein